MKKIFTVITCFVFSITVLSAQNAPPQAFSFKASISGNDGLPIPMKLISLRISILQSEPAGSAVYIETFNPTTNGNSQVDINIGTGTLVTGDFLSINWPDAKYFLKIELDIDGGSDYELLSVSQLLSVPYALYAGSAGNSTFNKDLLINELTVGKGEGAVAGNSAFGIQALYSNKTGFKNTAIGDSSLHSNDVGFRNTANGYQTLYWNTEGYKNTATGANALFMNNTGNNNTAIGSATLFSNIVGRYNTATGSQALYSNVNGISNTANGYQALFLNVTGESNVADGFQALFSNDVGRMNTAVGNKALFNCKGNYNTAIGSNALYGNKSGFFNTAVGNKALNKNTGGFFNTAVGDETLYYSQGNNNVAVGHAALFNNLDGNGNSAFGDEALYNNKSGLFNTAIGYNALFNTTNTNNVAVGYLSGKSIGDGFRNTIIGSSADVENSSMKNSIAIGFEAIASGDNQVRLGDKNIGSLYCQGAYDGAAGGSEKRILYADNTGRIGYEPSSVKYKSNIKNMEPVEWLYMLRPVNFTYKSDAKANKQYGLIAEEVEKVIPEFVGYNNEGQPETVSYSSLISPLLKAVQEQQKQIQSVSKQNQQLKSLLQSLLERIEGIEAKFAEKGAK